MKTKMLRTLFLLLVPTFLFVSCGGDDNGPVTPPEPPAKSTEAKIVAMAFKQAQNTVLNEDITAEINESTKEILVTINAIVDASLFDKKLTLIPDFSYSSKATVAPENNKAVEVDNVTPVTFTVTAEDGETKNTYTLKTKIRYINKQVVSFIDMDDFIALNALKEANPTATGNVKNWNFKLSGPAAIKASLTGLSLDSNKKVEALFLFNNNLSTLPLEIKNLTAIKNLNLSSNPLQELPKQIGSLKSLVNLDLDKTKLKELPSEIAELLELEKLSAEENELTTLPSAISKLQKLKKIYLKLNKFKEVPKEVYQLKNLEYIGFWDNDLTSISPDIKNLTKLKTLDLEFNDIKSLPKEIGELTALEYIYLKNNNLENGGLPEEMKNLSSLRFLDIRNNSKLTTLSTTLCTFFKSLPSFLKDVTC